MSQLYVATGSQLYGATGSQLYVATGSQLYVATGPLRALSPNSLAACRLFISKSARVNDASGLSTLLKLRKSFHGQKAGAKAKTIASAWLEKAEFQDDRFFFQEDRLNQLTLWLEQLFGEGHRWC